MRVALCVLVDDLPLVASLCAMAPDVPIALDHCGFADLGGPADELFALARQPNLRLKVTTTLLEPVRDAGLDPREVVERLCDAFGVERLMWGSDYPQHHHEPYPAIVELARHACSRLTPDEQARFLGGTALDLLPELTRLTPRNAFWAAERSQERPIRAQNARNQDGAESAGGSAQALNHHGHALAAADAHRLDAELFVGILETVDQRRHDAGTGHAERVTQRNCAAVDVELLPRDLEVVGRRHDLRGERFVDLEQVDVADGERDRPTLDRLSACLIASIGPRPMISGLSAVTPELMILASGLSPSACAFLSPTSRATAAAPSLSGQALPAVTVPLGLNTGLSPESASTVVPARGQSSLDTTVPSANL